MWVRTWWRSGACGEDSTSSSRKADGTCWRHLSVSWAPQISSQLVCRPEPGLCSELDRTKSCGVAAYYMHQDEEAASLVGGTMLAVPFAPVWAICVGRREASVLCLSSRPQMPALEGVQRGHPRPSAAAQSWVSAIYDAHGRRAHLGWLDERGVEEELRAGWTAYWLACRRLKRRWRRAR